MTQNSGHLAPAPATVGDAPARLADLTTLRVGGPVRELVDAATEAELVDAVRAADDAGAPVLVLGGGSNLLVSDEGFDGVVVRDARRGIDGVADSSCAGANLVVPAGQPWDEVVATAVAEGWMGVEALSGIPGSTGATPVQNVGAYGQEVAETLSSVRVYDRLEHRTRMLAVGELGLGYRTSILKRSLTDPDAGGGRVWGPTGRYVVLEVSFQLRLASLSAPVRYAELARRLDVAVGDRVPAARVREAVLELRRGKGMVLDDADPDTWSAGSFFTNPVLTTEEADARLPEDAPRFRSPTTPGSPRSARPHPWSRAWSRRRRRGSSPAPGSTRASAPPARPRCRPSTPSPSRTGARPRPPTSSPSRAPSATVCRRPSASRSCPSRCWWASPSDGALRAPGQRAPAQRCRAGGRRLSRTAGQRAPGQRPVMSAPRTRSRMSGSASPAARAWPTKTCAAARTSATATDGSAAGATTVPVRRRDTTTPAASSSR